VLPRPEERTSTTLYLVIAALIAGVVIADLMSPLGLAVWVFYMVPLGACLFSRSPLLPLQLAVLTTACITLITVKPFTPEPLVERWLAFGNRGMYVTMFWVVAYMMRQLILARLASDREEWLRGMQANLLVNLQGELSTAEVAKRSLSGLVAALGAPVGALYVKDGPVLVRAASHALESHATPSSFRTGEGLIGQAALSGKGTILDNLPEGFLRIDAGVGAGRPTEVVVSPSCAHGEPVAVLALGTTRRHASVDHELLERVSSPMAMALVSAQHKKRLEELLDESQRQAEELQSQQAELETQQAELEATNEELNQTNSLMEVQTEELERRRGELVKEREVADRASQYKSEFLANMSHELRTPLNSSLILARLLADNKEGNLSAEQVRSAETIYSAGNDLLALINDILDLSKIESGRAEVVNEAVSVPQLLEVLERSFRPVAVDKGLELRVQASADCPDRISTDGRRLEQILKNLLSNALKFTERGKVELEIAPASRGWLAFSVSDTGIGITPEQREVIFEAFRQADGTTSRKYGGTGLGLSISRELARLLGGRLEVVSRLGEGSRFSLLLPLDVSAGARPQALDVDVSPRRTLPPKRERLPPKPRPAPAEPVFPDDRAHLTRRGRTILAVEDDLPFARILYDLAHELDFDCVVATTADDALALARELRPSGIVLDVGLPDASGLSVLEMLKRDPATRHIPVHMVSSSDNVHTALELGAIGYALKPVAREELALALRKLHTEQARDVRHVLIVEDDPVQQASVRELLTGQLVQLTTAGSVKEALAELERATVDCMVLDLSLPDGSGYDLLDRMGESSSRQAFPPVIIYTGRELTRADEDRLRRHVRSIIVKGPRSPERLLDEVTLFLHQVESTLPPEQRRMLAEARQRESAFEGRCILVVEDDVRNVFALSKVLEPRGAKVEISRNGREALDLLARKPDIDLVLMDLMMPEMDGLAAMREIRRNPAFKRLPIIALTAKAMPDDRDQAIAAGANDYMAKPFEVERLVSLCRVWLPK
jgi:signal transduction histidine kinase/DNA-binding response OmpR family regulator